MNFLRTHIALFVIALLSAGLYFWRFLDASMDVLAIVSVVLIAIAALNDVRMLLVGWFLVSPYFVPTAAEGSSNIASNLGHNYLVPLMTVIILSYYFIKRKKLRFGKEDIFLLLFIAYAIVSSVLATKGRYDDIRQLYLIYILPYFLYLITKNIEIDSQLLKWLGFIAIFHLVQACFLSVYEIQNGTTLYAPNSVVNWVDVGGMRRTTGSVGSPIIFGVFLQVMFGFIFLAYRFDMISRLAFRLCLPILVALNIMTFTRSVWLGAFVAFVYLMYKTSEDFGAKLLRTTAIVVFAVMIVGVLIAASPDIQKRLSGEENANFRIVMAEASIHMFVDKPIMGWGSGTFDDYSDRYLFDALGVYIIKDTSHVTLLTILAELGILGAIPFLLFIYSSLQHKGIHLSELALDDRLIVAVNVGTIIAFVVNAFLIDMRFYSLAYCWFFMSLGFMKNIYSENLEWRAARA